MSVDIATLRLLIISIIVELCNSTPQSQADGLPSVLSIRFHYEAAADKPWRMHTFVERMPGVWSGPDPQDRDTMVVVVHVPKRHQSM